MTEWLKRLGVALRKVLPLEPLPDEFVRLCEALDRMGTGQPEGRPVTCREEGFHPCPR